MNKGSKAAESFESTFSPYICGIIYMVTCSFSYTSLGLCFNLVKLRNKIGFG